MNKIKISRKQIKGWFKKSLKTLAEKSFFTSLCLILFSLALGGFLFYKYDVLLERQEPQSTEVLVKLQTQSYQKIVAEWQTMSDNFDKADLKNYTNPFSASSTLTK